MPIEGKVIWLKKWTSRKKTALEHTGKMTRRIGKLDIGIDDAISDPDIPFYFNFQINR